MELERLEAARQKWQKYYPEYISIDDAMDIEDRLGIFLSLLAEEKGKKKAS